MTAEPITHSEEVIRAAIDALPDPPLEIKTLIAEYEIAMAHNLKLEAAIHALTKRLDDGLYP